MVDWTQWLRIGLGVDIASGILFLAFAMFAALKRPRTKMGLAGATFALGWASIGIHPNLQRLGDPGAGADILGTTGPTSPFLPLGFLLLIAGILWLTRLICGRWPRSLTGHALLGITALAGLMGILSSLDAAASLGLEGRARWTFTSDNTLPALISPLLLWMAVSIPDRPGQYGLVAYAIAPLAGAWVLTISVEFARAQVWQALVPAGLALCVALPALARRRHPRMLAWTLGWWALALAWGWALVGHRPNDLGLIGVTRLLAVGILVYAIVRYRAFDIDVKLRFTLRQSTVAGIFVAVFVGVQAAVGEYVTATAGIAAGALATTGLVFALGPLQRFGERVAASAMPRAVPIAERSPDDRQALYAALASEAWSDGNLNAKEARVLALAWGRLGLTAAQAAAIEAKARPA